MRTLVHKEEAGGSHVIEVRDSKEGVIYTTDGHATREAAESAAKRWDDWADGVPTGAADSIYYILAIPLVWPGPPPGAHRYSGLHFKIGRTNDVLKRLQNLKTGTSDDLIIHALEPGDARIEAERHRKFASDRRQGEWFAASPVLCEHVIETWRKNRILPPEHQRKILSFLERSRIYSHLRSTGFKFDMINPSLNEPWFGSVFVDLVHTSLLRGDAENG